MGKSILVVDDSESARQLVTFTLKAGGYEAIEAVDGNDAMNKLNNTSVNMVITDLNMPNMDGIELIKQIRRSPTCKHLPIVILSTESERDKVLAAKTAGVTGWIIKPFTPEQLTGIAKKILG